MLPPAPLLALLTLPTLLGFPFLHNHFIFLEFTYASCLSLIVCLPYQNVSTKSEVIFGLFVYTKLLKLSLTNNRGTINICWKNEWMWLGWNKKGKGWQRDCGDDKRLLLFLFWEMLLSTKIWQMKGKEPAEEERLDIPREWWWMEHSVRGHWKGWDPHV